MRLSVFREKYALYLISNVVRGVVEFLMIPLYTRFLTSAGYGCALPF